MNLMIVCKFFINICHKHIHFKNSLRIITGIIKDRKKLKYSQERLLSQALLQPFKEPVQAKSVLFGSSK